MSSRTSPGRDNYGVALVIFGNHHPDFFPLLGRVVALASVVEYETRSTASRLLRPEICGVWKARLSDVAKKSLTSLGEASDPECLAPVARFIREAADYSDRRAVYAHGLLPSMSLASPDQVTAWRTKPGTDDLALGEDLELLRGDVKRGSELVERWNNSLLPILNRLPLLQYEAVSE